MVGRPIMGVGRKGSCPIRAAKIVALLLSMGCQDHGDLVTTVTGRVRAKPAPAVSPDANTAIPDDILTPAVHPFRKQAPRHKRTPYNNKAANLKQRARRPRLSDEQAGLIRTALEATGLTVSAWVRKELGNRYEVAYAISPEPGMRVPLAPHIVSSIITKLGLEEAAFANLLVRSGRSQ